MDLDGRTCRPAVFCAALALGSLTAQQQAPTTSAFTFSKQVVNVNVDVSVLDRSGRPVTNLRAQDFRVFEDGVPQRIVLLRSPAARPSTAVTTESKTSQPKLPDESASGRERWLALVFDLENTSLSGVTQTRNALMNIADQLCARMSIAVFAMDGALRLVGDFTADPVQLRRALETIKPRGDFSALREQQRLMQRLDSACVIKGPTPRVVPGCGLGMANEAAQHEAARSRATLQTLAEVVRMMRPLAGVKRLFLLSDGLALVPGRAIDSVARMYIPEGTIA